MAQPLAVDGAIQSLERSLRRADSDFFSPSTRTSRLLRTQSSTAPALPWSPGIAWCDSTSMRSAPGNRASTSRAGRRTATLPR